MTEATLSPEFLARMDEAIAEEFERSSRLRKILPAEVDMPHARYGVVVPRTREGPQVGVPHAHAETKVLRPPITLQREIRISARQLEDLDLVLSLVRDATKRIAAVEDQIIAYGGLLPLTGSAPQEVQIEGLRKRTEGLFGPGSKVDPIKPHPLPSEPGGRLTAVVQEATSRLDLHDPAFHAPYAAAMAPTAWRIYVPSDDDDDKKAIVAALQSRDFAPVNGRELKCPEKEAAAFDDLLEEIESAITKGADVDGIKQALKGLLKKQEQRIELHPLTKSRMCALVATLIVAADESAAPLGIADIKALLLAALSQQTEKCPKPFVSVFSSDPVDLDLARVRRPWGSFRGYDDAGCVRYVVENQFLLRVKRAAAICAVWVTGFDAEHQPDAFERLYVDEGP